MPPLHDDFCTAIRTGWEQQKTTSQFAARTYCRIERGQRYTPPESHLKRLRQLARTIKYFGPLLQLEPERDEVA